MSPEVAGGAGRALRSKSGPDSQGTGFVPLAPGSSWIAESADGGVQTVTSDDPADTQQVGLIREHLTAEAAGRLAWNVQLTSRV
jgi:hypothetical protein